MDLISGLRKWSEVHCYAWGKWTGSMGMRWSDGILKAQAWIKLDACTLWQASIDNSHWWAQMSGVNSSIGADSNRKVSTQWVSVIMNKAPKEDMQSEYQIH